MRVFLLLGALALAVTIMALTGKKSVHTEIVIPGTPQEIWRIITDPAGYQAWNPILVQAQGSYQEGETISYQMRDESGKDTAVKSKVVSIEPNAHLNQFGGMRGILTFDHHWRLTPQGEGTKVEQFENYRGIGVWFWDPAGVHRLYQRANEALKARVLELRAVSPE